MRGALAVFGVFALGMLVGSPAAGANEKEAAVKAALLYQFASLTQWPESAFESDADAFRLGVIGDPKFASSLRSARCS